jgi:4-diphosphocytidyl-2-C-methyl-D-erythritol kinase
MTVRAPAPAKLNLYLHVLGRRADGYHLLDSLVAFADIADEIIAEAAPALSLRLEGPFAGGLAPAPQDNLVWRAATLLAAHLRRAPAASLTLVKNLPLSSGIGGGSSDAAATLRALLSLWQAKIDERALHALALQLGADVPVCLAARTAWLGGVGEQVEPAPALPPLAVVLANPGAALPTAAVFQRFAAPFSAPARFAAPPRDGVQLAAWLAERRNDLTASAMALVPELGAVLTRLAAAEGALIARMSGSGATCFALFSVADAAASTAKRLRAEHPNWWVAAGRLL